MWRARSANRSLALAGEAGLASVAFPCISTGIFGYPLEPAARIAIDAVTLEAPRYPSIEQVIFCCYSARDAAVYRPLLG